MRTLLVCMFILEMLVPAAWAKEEFIMTTNQETYEDIDRFLVKNVWPHIRTGDVRLHEAKEVEVDWRARSYKTEVAIAHYLKALVLIEEERMRRGK